MKGRQIITRIFIKGKGYEMEDLQNIFISTLLDILIRYNFFGMKASPNDLLVKWGISKNNQINQQQQKEINPKDLEILISEFKRQELGNDSFEDIYFRVDYKNEKKKVEQLKSIVESAVDVPQEVKPNNNEDMVEQIEQTEQIEQIELLVRKKTKTVKEEEQKIEENKETTEQEMLIKTVEKEFEQKQAQTDPMDFISISILTKIIKKIYHHEKLQTLLERLNKDRVPKEIIDSVVKLSEDLRDRNLKKQKLEYFQRQIPRIISQQLPDERQSEQPEQIVKTVGKSLEKLRSKIIEMQKNQQKELQKYKYPHFMTYLIHHPQRQGQFQFLLSTLHQISRIKHLQVSICLKNLTNIKFDQFISLLSSFEKQNSLLVLGFEAYTLAVFIPNGVLPKTQSHEARIYPSEITEAEKPSLSFVAELKNKVVLHHEMNGNHKMMRFDNHRIIFGKDIFYLTFNLFFKSIELSHSAQTRLQYKQIYDVTPKSILKTFQLYELSFED